jgi:hypothetical protein
MIFGMLPVAFGVGEGAETRSPMGVSVIGGLLTSLFLTLAVVPAAYDLFDDGQEWMKRGEYRKLVTRGYWAMRIRQIPELLKQIRRAPQAAGWAWTFLKRLPGAVLSVGTAIAGLVRRKRGGPPPNP